MGRGGDLSGKSVIGLGRLPPWLLRGASLVLFLALWEGAAAAASSRLLPTPWAVGYALIESLIAGSLLRDLAMTLFRVALAFLFALVLGAAIGYAMGRSRSLDRLFDSWLTLLLNLPALVLIVLMYVWFGLNEPTAIAAVALNKLPSTAVTLREGARALDPALLEMAASYRLGRMKTLRHVILPQLSPYFFAASRSGLAIIWKIVLVVELLGRSNGVGFAIEQYFQLFDVTHILAYTLAFILVVQGIEWLVWQPWERRINRWRT